MLSWGLLSVMMLQSNMSLSSQSQIDSGIGVRAAMAMSAAPPGLCMGLYFRIELAGVDIVLRPPSSNMKYHLAFLDLSL